ncbi:hypothetical protein [Nocardioides sp.]|uniref:hypothetical protein n=1 Tax=Nocardioides sp. TaxID=35761 RepID=UPI002B27B41F|nr:hypothetical protein [Nocardioides sp.]
MTTASGRRPGLRWVVVLVLGLVLGLVALLALAGATELFDQDSAAPAGDVGSADPSVTGPTVSPSPTGSPTPSPSPSPSSTPSPTPSPAPVPVETPQPRERVFAGNRTLVAYYGTASSGALGVLGEERPDAIIGRLTRAARAFERPGRPVQVVFELIVTIADAVPGPDGDFNHDIARADVERYVRAAHRHDALLLLDVQPGRASFVDVAKRWTWALRDPRVGLALDPEWRMTRTEVPGRVIGRVDAAEVNEVSLWLANLTRRERLPQKLFVLHQFRTSMIERIGRVAVRQRLATVQHVDGFGTGEQKIATMRAVLRADKFHSGFKLFYDEDVGLMSPARVLAIRPRVRFISYQ